MFVLYGDDFGVRISDGAPATARCPACGEIDGCGYVPEEIGTSRRLGRDLKCSFEGALVVSPRFAEVCRTDGLQGAARWNSASVA
jgi:hypothetical protein